MTLLKSELANYLSFASPWVEEVAMPGRPPRLAACAVAAAIVLAVAPAAARAAQEEAELVEVSGTVVVEDVDGSTANDESGTIVVGVHEGSGWRPQHVFLIEGAWKTKVPAGSKLSFELFSLDDRIACWVVDDEVPTPAARRNFVHDGVRGSGLAIPADRRLAIRARFVPACRVHVVDAETGAELGHVDAILDVYHSGERSTNAQAHSLGKRQIYPTSWWRSDVRAHDAGSPIELEFNREETFPRWSENLWLHAPGYCWAGVSVDYERGGDSTVKLARGGTLDLKIESERLPEQTKIVLRSAGDGSAGVDLDDLEGEDSALLEWPGGSKPREVFDGIPPGRYRVSLEVGNRFESRLTFATTEVEVTAGRAVTAKLIVEEAPEIPDPVPLRGSIRVDPGWSDLPYEVVIEPVEISPLLKQERLRFERDQLFRDPADPASRKLPASRIAPGTYSLRIEALGVAREFAAMRAARPVAIEVGPPIAATVRFVDARTHAPIPTDEPSWSIVDPAGGIDEFMGGFIGGPRLRHGDARVQEVHSLRVPAGRIALSAGVEDYDEFTPIAVDVSAEQSDITVPLRHLTGVRITFRLDGKPLEWSEAIREEKKDCGRFTMIDYEPKIRPRRVDPAVGFTKDGGKVLESGEDGECGSGCSRGAWYLAVRNAGDYTVTLPPLKGYQPIPTRDVTIADQEFTEVVIDLVPMKK
jgi:hypothetical protein